MQTNYGLACLKSERRITAVNTELTIPDQSFIIELKRKIPVFPKWRRANGNVEQRKIDNPQGLDQGGQQGSNRSRELLCRKKYRIHVTREGDLLLENVAIIPEKELWLYQNSNALKSFRQGLEEATAG